MISFADFLKSKNEEVYNLPEKIEAETANITESNVVEESQNITVIEESIQEEPEKRILAENTTKPQEIQPSGYKIYRDKSETFLCELEITGADPNNSKARIIIETQNLTYMFEGSISEEGKCKIPLKSMSFLKENETGKIKLEVIADDMVFSPWEDDFYAANSKKVAIKVLESVDETPKVGVRVTTIR
jgi:hypothetical protein